VPSIKEECLEVGSSRSANTTFGEGSRKSSTNYHPERNHQGLENRLIEVVSPPREGGSGGVHDSAAC